MFSMCITNRQRRARGSVVGACSGRRPWQWRRASSGAVGIFSRKEEGGAQDDHALAKRESWSHEDCENCNGQLGRSGDHQRTHSGDSAVAGKFLAELRDVHGSAMAGFPGHIVAKIHRQEHGGVVRDHGSVGEARRCLQSAGRDGS